MNDKQLYEEYYGLAGALRQETLVAIINDLEGYNGRLGTIRQACRDRLQDKRRSVANAIQHGWIKP